MISPQRCIVELGHYLGSNGADEFGPIHMAVTEGRAPAYAKRNPRSTSCGDQLHRLLFAAGCREPFVNGDEHNGWRSAVNLSRIFVPPWPGERILCPTLDELDPGDFGIYDYSNRRAHGFVFLGLDGLGRAITSDFGQPGGKIYHCEISEPVRFAGSRYGRPLRFRGRPFDAVIKIASLPFTEPAESVAEWCARKSLDIEPWHPLEHFREL